MTGTMERLWLSPCCGGDTCLNPAITSNNPRFCTACGTYYDRNEAREIPPLSEAQQKMLIKAAKTRKARAFVGRGQASTAKALLALQLGGYTGEGTNSSASFWLWDGGLTVARRLDPDAVAWGEGLRKKHGEPERRLYLLER